MGNPPPDLFLRIGLFPIQILSWKKYFLEIPKRCLDLGFFIIRIVKGKLILFKGKLAGLHTHFAQCSVGTQNFNSSPDY